ncbi:hypothetical protein AB0K51_34195, partial [Kitasatospora sp. NPDC049285]|uniref:hypothetical protein n=1 Tax=Kitasatospora sp. NPDC049285 TaxID=3157096 RepID=UPI003424CB8A
MVQPAAGLADVLGVLPGGRVLGVDATARELSSVVDRMRVLGLVDDGVANVLRRSLTRPADAAEFTLAWRAAVPAATAQEIARRYRQALDSPITRDMATRMGLEVSASVGPGGANHPDDVAKVRRFLTDEGFETPRTPGHDPATALLAAYLKDGAHNPRLTPADAAAIRDTLLTVSHQRAAALDATEVREAHDTIERIGEAFTDADDGQPVPEAPPLVEGWPAATREVAGLRQPHVLVAERQVPPTSADVGLPHRSTHPAPATPSPAVAAPIGVSFAKGSTTLDPGTRLRIIETARALAAMLDARHRQGLQPPVVTVTGSGEGRLTAAATGRARATAVADELHRRLTEELDRLDSPAHATIRTRTRTTGHDEAPAELFPGWSADARRRTAVISLDHTPVADHLNLLETRTGVLIGDPRPYSTATNQRHQHALDHLPHRDDTYTVAMHIGDTGAPISPEQLADVLRAAHDSGKLDGKTRIDFLSCRLGALTERHVPSALSALWAHQQANPRPGVSGPLTGRAPVGDVWVLPKMVNGEADFTTHREVIVADHVGIDTHGKPVIVLGPDSLWRTYTHSGDTDHTPHTTLSGGHLTPHGDTDHHLPTGYTNHQPTHPTDPTHTLQPLDGATKFGRTRGAGRAASRSGPIGPRPATKQNTTGTAEAVGGAGVLLERLGLVVDPVSGDGNCLFHALVRMHPEHGSAADLRDVLAEKFKAAFNDFATGPNLLTELLADNPHLFEAIDLQQDVLADQLAHPDLYDGLMKRIRDNLGPAWDDLLDTHTADRRWDNAFGTAATHLYTRHFERGLLIADPATGHVTALHPDGDTTQPDSEQATRLATDHHYTVLAHTPGHYNATTPTPPATQPAAPTAHRPRRSTAAPRRGGRRPTGSSRSGPDVTHHDAEPIRIHQPLAADGPGPAKPVTFRGRLQPVFHATANKTAVIFQGVAFSLPRTGRERFANKPLRGELVGGQVRFTNPDGQPFHSKITEATGDQKFIPAGTTSTRVFGMQVALPKAPAGQGGGDVFEGWHVRVAGEVGRRMVQLSVTGGDAFEPVGDPIPYDEPSEEYKYRRAVEQAGKPYTPPTYSPPDPTDKGAFVGRLPREFRTIANEDSVSVGSRQVKLPNRDPERFANKPLTGTRTDTEATFTNLDGQWFTHTLGVAQDQVLVKAGIITTVFGVRIPVPKAPADPPAGAVFEGWHMRLTG